MNEAFRQWCEDNGGQFHEIGESEECVWEGQNTSKVSVGTMGAVMVKPGDALDVREQKELIRRPVEDDTGWEEVRFNTFTDRVGDPIASELHFEDDSMTVVNREDEEVIHEISVDVIN